MFRVRRRRHVVLPVDDLVPLSIVWEVDEILVRELHGRRHVRSHLVTSGHETTLHYHRGGRPCTSGMQDALHAEIPDNQQFGAPDLAIIADVDRSQVAKFCHHQQDPVTSECRIPIPVRIDAMPPRYAYWTILIDHKPTAFRAREKEELQPTCYQLQRANKDVVMKWFARGRLWETPEQAHEASRRAKGTGEKRGRDWRPGGQHKDPRDRFKKRLRPAPSKNSRGATSGSLEPQAPGLGPRRREGYGASRVFDKRLRPTPSEKGGAPSAAPAMGRNSRGATSGSLEPQAPGVGPLRREGGGTPRVFAKGPRPRESRPWHGKPPKPAQTVKKPEPK